MYPHTRFAHRTEVFERFERQLNVQECTLEVGETISLRLEGFRRMARFSSSDFRVASVTPGGKVHARAPGTVVITAKYHEHSYHCKITVVAMPFYFITYLGIYWHKYILEFIIEVQPTMKKYLFYVIFLAYIGVITCFPPLTLLAKEKNPSQSGVDISATAAVLMEGSTGNIIYEKNKDKELIPASITKIMTLTLIWEEIKKGNLSLNDSVTVSEYASGMGGSQVFLEPNETQTVNDMMKCISIASANDAAVAMAEKIAGSEEAFVKRMNEKAKQLGMKHTQFKNCTGLDDNIDSGHYSSAYDVALMSRELITKHPEISNYSTVWMDSITHKTKKGETEFGLTNTNKLVRFYEGITGLKTGSTSKAKYCLSATARRNDMDLIAVVMAAPDHKKRFSEAQTLLDYGFANCYIYKDTKLSSELKPIPLQGGKSTHITPVPKAIFSHIFTGDIDTSKIQKKISYLPNQKAPLKKGAVIGNVEYFYEQSSLGNIPLLASETIDEASFSDYIKKIFRSLFHKA